ncbi:MAG: penicillin-binding protein 2 [Pseudomonadota bacterium]|nr:penicillin-binding protein 2 [Pseudomonadota bacterium]
MQSAWRQYFIYSIVAIAFIFILARIILLQGFNTDCFIFNLDKCKTNLSEIAEKRQIASRSIDTNRGTIFDRNNEILAMSLPRKTLCINPSLLYNLKKEDLKKYHPLLEIIGEKKSNFLKIVKKFNKRKEYYLRRKVSDKTALKIEKLNLKFVYFIKEYQRVYLGGESFSNVLGFTDIDDIGQEGIELSKDDVLSSTKGIKKIRKDNLGRAIETIEIIKQPIAGQDIKLALDKNIQIIGYNILKKYVDKFSAESASLILIRNKTGEIISMANYPSFNPDLRHEMSGTKIKNRIITEIIEPGSTMKPFLIFAALNSEEFSKEDIVDTTPGFIRIGGKIIKDPSNYGKLSLGEIIERSSNIGAIRVAQQLEKKDLWENIKLFQFGDNLYTGLSGEQHGELKHHSAWDDSQQATIGYGYGISTTLLHLCNAYTILANHGKYIPLTYEKIEDISSIYKEEIVDEDLSKEIIGFMTRVVQNKNGTGKRANLEKYTVAGKTGTARIFIKGKYADDKHLALFVGIVPASNPQYVAAIMVKNPNKGNASGGKNAAPIFKEFMSQALTLLKVYPDRKILKNEKTK